MRQPPRKKKTKKTRYPIFHAYERRASERDSTTTCKSGRANLGDEFVDFREVGPARLAAVHPPLQIADEKATHLRLAFVVSEKAKMESGEGFVFPPLCFFCAKMGEGCVLEIRRAKGFL